jgi:hypothetical protein
MRTTASTIAAFILAIGWTGLPSMSATDHPLLPADPDALYLQSTAAAVAGPSSRPGGARRAPVRDPFRLISQQSLLGYLEDLTSIQPNSGWRSATTDGEAEAFAYLQQKLSEFGFLRSLGIGIQFQSFRTYKAIEFHETRIDLSTGGQSFEVPADCASGHRDRMYQARRFDSDGVLNDSNRDPVVVEGAPVAVRSAEQISNLTPAELAGRIVLLDYAVVDRITNDYQEAIGRAHELLENEPAGVVLVTSFSNRQNESHGSFVGDLNAFTSIEIEPQVPILNLRIEDLEAIGITSWQQLEEIDSVRMTWDVDIHEVGSSGYLVVRIPGQDSTRSVILGAHLDSSNTPGAFDNGSGSVTLLEIARVLDAAHHQPPTDLHLVWFGGHEIGLYGSLNFTAANSELLDRAIAMLQMDCLGHPLDGISNYLTVEAWPYGRFGDERLPWPDYIESIADPQTAPVEPVVYYGMGSDNGSFGAYNVPNALLIYMNPYDPTEVHYANHMHDPYDAMELAELEAEVLEDMARIMLTAGLRTGVDNPDLRVIPDADRRALFVASHTEAIHMSGSAFTEFGMALGWEGFDVDTIPYGQQITEEDLADADLVVALPVHDYPSPEGDPSLYDEGGWQAAEVDALESYVRNGGLLVLTNSAHRLKYSNLKYESNEDWEDQNALAERFGVSFIEGTVSGDEAGAVGTHPLVQGVDRLVLVDSNAVRFTAIGDRPLARSGLGTAAAAVEVGDGEVIVLGDVGILGTGSQGSQNFEFLLNLASYAR